jgi:hypothetical protein
MNPHKLHKGATYHTPNPFDAMSIAQSIGGRVFRYSLGFENGAFGYAVTLGNGAILFNKESLLPCDQWGKPLPYPPL